MIRRPTEQTSTSRYFTENQFHKMSSSNSGDEHEEDDFAQTYEGEESFKGDNSMAKADNKYSQRAIRKLNTCFQPLHCHNFFVIY